MAFDNDNQTNGTAKKRKAPLKKHDIMVRLTEPDYWLFDSAAGGDPMGPFIERMAKVGIEKSNVPWETILDVLKGQFIWLALMPKDAQPTQEQVEDIWHTYICPKRNKEGNKTP